MKNLFLSLILASIFGCSTFPFSGQGEYRSAIAEKSAGDRQFAGLDHKFEFRATVLDDEVLTLINNRLATFYSWDASTQQKMLQKEQEKSAGKTRLFMSFYTANSRNDNLSNKKSIWKVYLHSGGQRFEGKVKKARFNLSEATATYPYHNRWSTPYYVEFPTETATLDRQNLAFEISGPLGNRKVQF